MREVILCKYGEIILKGANKSWFEGILIRDLRKRLARYGEFEVRYNQSIVYDEPVSDDCDMDGAFEEAKRAFGFASISRAAVVEKDMEISDDAVTEKDSQGGERSTNQSSRSETTIYTEENGKPYISKEISPKVEGVLILAEGGDNSVVVKNITEGIQALFGIESHKIRIVKKGG